MRRRLLAPAAPPLLACGEVPTLTRIEDEPAHVVLFNEHGASPEAPAQELARAAADASRRDPGPRVDLVGHAGPAGGVVLCRALSERRAGDVAALSRGFGVPRGPVPFEPAPVESRRVATRPGRS
jgi:outer membrane protein OmpA-like peptidoglycan-associated protein